MNRSVLALAAAVSLTLSGCGFERVVGSGVEASELRKVSDVTALTVSSFITASVTVTDGPSTLTLSCDDNLLEHIVASVEDGHLEIGAREDTWLESRLTCTADVEVKRLDEVHASGAGHLDVLSDLEDTHSISASGAGTVTIGVLSTCDLAVDVSGAGDVEVADLAACGVDADVSGSGNLLVTEGAAEDLTLDVSGSGDFGTAGFSTEVADIEASGAGDVELTVTRSVAAAASGAGDIVVHGNPDTRAVDTSGAGDVTFE